MVQGSKGVAMSGLFCLDEVPDGEGYAPTNQFAFAVRKSDARRTLCQRWESLYSRVSAIWVKIPDHFDGDLPDIYD